jgi:putative ABC transport system permease protein
VTAVLLLARHLLGTLARQRGRTLALWLALTVGLAVVVGLLSFVRSVEDSFADHRRAIGGVADLRVEAVAQTSLPAGLAARLERLPGTRAAVAIAQQRVALEAGGERVAVTAFGIDRRARLLRSALDEELRPPRRDADPAPRAEDPQQRAADPPRGEDRRPRGRADQPARGLTLSRPLADQLGVRAGEHVRVFAFADARRVRVERVADTIPALANAVALPRAQVERLRGAPGRPTVIHVRLRDGVARAAWERRARTVLPANAVLASPAGDERELDHVLDFTVRSPTLVFGTVVLAIVALLVYVLQLMRMLERQEDVGLVRALGAGRVRLALAEALTLTLLVAAAVVPGALAGVPIAHGLARQVPTYLTDVFGFDVLVTVEPLTVAVAGGLAFALALAATAGALLSLRGPVAEQLGRSPQAGATVTSRISPRAALALLAGGGAGFAGGALLSDAGAYPAATLATLVGIALATPGLVGLAALAVGRSERGHSRVVLVARAALVANPRRAALAAAILALGIAAVIPTQLVGGALQERVDAVTAAIRPEARELLASDDAYASVPVTPAWAARALRGGPQRLRRHAALSAVSFLSVPGYKLELRALDPRARHPVFAPGAGLSRGLPALRRHPDGVLVSRVLTAGLGLGAGDRIALPTAHGERRLRIVGEVEDLSWPSGTVYVTMERYRTLWGSPAANLVGVAGPGRLRPGRLAEMAPLHTISGRELAQRVRDQMDRSTAGLAAMRLLTLAAALVAVGGILATSIFARRREWAVLRALGMRGRGLVAALALETGLVMVLGAVAGTAGGILSFRGPMLAFMRDEGYVLSDALLPGALALAVLATVCAATLIAALPAWLTARAPLVDTLAYE